MTVWPLLPQPDPESFYDDGWLWERFGLVNRQDAVTLDLLRAQLSDELELPEERDADE